MWMFGYTYNGISLDINPRVVEAQLGFNMVGVVSIWKILEDIIGELSKGYFCTYRAPMTASICYQVDGSKKLEIYQFDWTSDVDNAKSTGAYILIPFEEVVIWKSKRQHVGCQF